MKLNHQLAYLAVTSLAAFTGSLQAAITHVNLGTAGDYVILAKSAITTTAGSAITGDLGISPAALSLMTGFGETLDSSGQFATSPLVTGSIFAASMGGTTAANLTTAIGDMQAAYVDAAGRSNPDFLNLGTGVLNATTQVLTPGLYKWASNVSITDSVTVDALGDANAVWIFQIDNRLTLASSAQILLAGNANPNNIVWQTAEGVTIGTNAQFQGNVLTMTDIAVLTDASVVGRLLAQTAVTLQSNDVTIVPEPATYAALLGFGILCLVIIRRRMK
jgi:hypothetical protein